MEKIIPDGELCWVSCVPMFWVNKPDIEDKIVVNTQNVRKLVHLIPKCRVAMTPGYVVSYDAYKEEYKIWVFTLKKEVTRDDELVFISKVEAGKVFAEKYPPMPSPEDLAGVQPMTEPYNSKIYDTTIEE